VFEFKQITCSSGAGKSAMPRLKRTETETALANSAGPEFLEALARGLRVLEAFNRERNQMTLADAAKAVGLPRASVRRTLMTLVTLGYAETDGRLFGLTPRTLTLANAYLSSNAISDIVQPALERLSADVKEACSCAVLDGDDVVMIAHASPNRLVAVSAQIGLRLPAYASSLGRVMLSAMDDATLDGFVARLKPSRLTPSTLTDKSEIRKAVVKVRKDGFSLVDQGVELGFRSISVPLRRRDGKIIAALNIGVHSAPLDVMRKTFLPKLAATADALRRQLI
jgi:IclR family pca regulon transcriptional regulator